MLGEVCVWGGLWRSKRSDERDASLATPFFADFQGSQFDQTQARLVELHVNCSGVRRNVLALPPSHFNGFIVSHSRAKARCEGRVEPANAEMTSC